MSGTYTDVFGGSAIRPSLPSYLQLVITEDTQLYWPLETAAGTDVVAAMINVSAGSGLHVLMPPGNTGSTGVQTMMTNVGSNTFQVTDSEGGLIATISTTQSWLIALTDNSTETGTWTALQMASTTSQAVAASLAGDGLVASSNKLYPSAGVQVRSSGTWTLAEVDRGTMNVWTGSVTGVFQLAAKATLNLIAGWFAMLKNDSAEDVILTTTGGDTIDGGGAITIGPGEGVIVVCGSTGFFTIRAVSAPVEIVSGGTGATTAPDALTNFGGTSIGQAIFTAPSAASVRALLGLTGSLLTESTVSTNQSLSAGSTNTAFVCTSSLIATLPLTTDLTTTFVVAFYAESGTLTITPQASDQINGAGAGVSASIAVGGSLMLVTDANGNWWPLFISGGNGNFTNLYVSGATTLTGAVTLGGAMKVAGATTLTGAATLQNTLAVTGNTTLGGTASVGGAATLGGAVVVVGASTLTGNASLAGTVSVAGAATLGGATTVTGALTGSTNAASGNQVPNLSQFVLATGDPMSATLPVNRLVVKGGTATSSTSGALTVTFGTAFPTANVAVVACLTGGAPNTYLVGVVSKSLTTVDFVTTVGGVGTSGIGFAWVAIGY